jgi:hypothetical protein
VKQFYVEIVEDETDLVVSRMGPMDERRANRVEDGAGINLNWEKFFTRVVESSEQEKVVDGAS